MSILISVSSIITLICVRSDQQYHDSLIETDTLSVEQINNDGFGDSANKYAFSMEVFKEHLYIGTLNSHEKSLKPFFYGLPFNTNGAQIYKGYTNESEIFEWKCVIESGNGNKDNYGIRKLKTIGSYLYAVTANHISGFELWRTFDGSNWEVITSNGLGDVENISGRGLVSYKEHIYIGVENRKTGAKIFKRSITANGDFNINSSWKQVTSNGFDDSNNIWVSDFVQYKGWLYIGTLNHRRGMQLWRTDGTTYESIFKNGNGAPTNFAAMKLYVYNGTLYIGTMNWIWGASLFANDDEQATKFKSVFTHGNGEEYNTYVWDMIQFNNRLYVGMFKYNREFDLFSSIDPTQGTWHIETNNAFGFDYHYGVRTMQVFENKLIIGTAIGTRNGSCKVFVATASSKDGNHVRKIATTSYLTFKTMIFGALVMSSLLMKYTFGAAAKNVKRI